jgi:hypothetical protein
MSIARGQACWLPQPAANIKGYDFAGDGYHGGPSPASSLA